MVGAELGRVWIYSAMVGVLMAVSGCGGAGANTDESAANPAGYLQFEASQYTVKESGGSITITVKRVQGSTGAVSVDYATDNATAQAGIDYTVSNGTLHWADGDNEAKGFTVTVFDDTVYEVSENIRLSLHNPVAASLGSHSKAQLTIEDTP